MTTDLTAADLARIESEHERRDDRLLDGEGRTRVDSYCAEDRLAWPCDTIRLVAAVRDLAWAIVAAGVVEGDRHEPDYPMRLARALLGDLDRTGV